MAHSVHALHKCMYVLLLFCAIL